MKAKTINTSIGLAIALGILAYQVFVTEEPTSDTQLASVADVSAPPEANAQPLPEIPSLPVVMGSPESRGESPITSPTNSESDSIISHTYYSLAYNEVYEQPDWVMYRLDDDFLTADKHKRKDDFRNDPAVPSGSASKNDYKGSGYDRGHLMPAADMAFSAEAISETFYMSNMSPQAPSFNRGIWKKLEEQVRDWALEDSQLYVVVGPVLKGTLATIGENEVAIPELYYKVILDYALPSRKAIAFVMRNEKLPGEIQDYAVTIDSVESLTGLDFFSNLPDSLEFALEAVSDTTVWFYQ